MSKAINVSTLKPFDPVEKKTRTWKQFRQDFESHCLVYRLNEVDYVTVLSYYLLGTAKALFYNEAEIAGGQHLLVYRELQEKLRSMFEIVHPVSYWANQFNERVWHRSDETADMFVSDLRLLASKAYPTLLNDTETFVYTQMRRSLSSKERNWCFTKNAETPSAVLLVLE
ncbi:MAG: hypothetical protein GY738_18635, partial [Pseudoalteromonas sp.]|nr:hypothetical protein [Pseudoalteromonas sp.]